LSSCSNGSARPVGATTHAISKPERHRFTPRTDRPDVVVEALGPQIRIGCGIDRLDVDTDLVGRSADASFQHAQLAVNLFCVDPLVLISERGIARDHEQICDPRQIARHILGDTVRNWEVDRQEKGGLFEWNQVRSGKRGGGLWR
jgi:hypothetical protein